MLIYKIHTKRRWRLQRQWLPDCFRPWHLAGSGWNLLPRFSQIQDEFSLWRGPRQIRIHLNKSQETAIIWKSVSSPPHRWPGTINTDQHCRSPTTAIACAAMRMAAGEGDALKFNSSSIGSHQNPIFTSFHWTRMLPMYSIDINCSSPKISFDWMNLFKVTNLWTHSTPWSSGLWLEIRSPHCRTGATWATWKVFGITCVAAQMTHSTSDALATSIRSVFTGSTFTCNTIAWRFVQMQQHTSWMIWILRATENGNYKFGDTICSISKSI